MCGEYGIPIELCCMPISGATGPMTMSGNVLVFNVEFLGCVVISQLVHPGAPVEYAPRPMILNLSNGIGLTGSIEGGMMSALHGPWTDSMIPDGQSSFERTHFAMMAAFSGAHVLSGSGMVHQGLTFSHIQLVIDDEINSTLLKALEGFKATDEHLGIDAISRVGPGGNFLADKHTIKYLREERYKPHILFRDSREAWVAGGSKKFIDRAKERAQTLINEHVPDPLPSDISDALDDLVKDATRLLEK
jgi:trimethylamine--corrinoid protein Co-methyltransferase